jgi:outer membrane protein assembly factor BamB
MRNMSFLRNEGWIRGLCGLGACVTMFVVVLAGSALAEQTESAARAQWVASPEPGWPQWRGPRRDGKSDETGLAATWPEGGPRAIWTATDLGRGYSAPVIQGDRLWLTGDVGEELRIFALDLEGKPVWQARNGASWKGPYPGARASVALSRGRLFHLNAHGRVVCLDAASGQELWALNLFEEFGGKNITWGISECLLVDGDRVMVTPGGTRALMAALDVRDGSTVWTSGPLRLGASELPRHERVAEPAGDTDNAGYASPILVEMGGRRVIVSCSLRHLFGVDATSGELLWTRPLPTRFEVIAAPPVLVGDAIFVTAPDAGGGRMYRFGGEAGAIVPELAWKTELDTCHGGVLHLDGTLFGAWYRARKGWAALDARTGAVRYELKEVPKGSLLHADGRLYALSEAGEMMLLRPGDGEFEVAGRFEFVGGRVNDVWAHPVVYGKRMYLRYHERLVGYDIAAP